MKERILCRKVMAWLMTAFMVITCLISIGGKNTAYAEAMENIKVTDVDISTDGHLRGLKWGWTTSGYASASCKLGIQSEKFSSGDLTDFGEYLRSHRYSGWANAESPEDCGFKGWITENSFPRSSGTYDRTDTISGEGIDMGTTGVYYLYTWTYYYGYVFPDIYIGSIDLDAGKIVDASGNKTTFQIGGFSGGGNTDPSEEEVVFMNNGYPYGKNMTNSSITLVMDVTGEAATYQWQSATSKRGPFTDIEGANGSTYTFTPTHGYWYRCVVDGTASRAVKAVFPSSDESNTWTMANECWYISNGVMAYMANDKGVDIVGLYTKDGKNYMLGTSYDKVWRLYSRSDSEPSAETATSQVSVASLAALRLSFDPMNTHDLIFDAELGEGQHSFAIGADANIGNEITSSDSADEAVLAATVKNGELQQIAMMGVAKAADAADDTPSFVLAPITQASYYWIGDYDSRRIFEYNTGSSSYIKETAEINGQNAASLVEGIDSGLTMSWTNVEDGGHIGFKFSVGAVADVGAVTGQVDYITENLTDLDGDTSYIITVDGESYEIVSDMYGDIALEGTDDNDVSYSLFGKNIRISKKDSQDTPADITVAARPEAPSAPKTLADIQNPTPADMESAADGEGVEIVSVTGDSVTVSPLGGQQYQYSMDGETWTVLDDLNVSDNYVISGLEENQRVYVRTRYVANTTRPASLWSDAKAVSRDLIAGVTAEDTTCTYDGLIHSPSVTIADSLDGASISYSLAADEPYTQSVPELKNAGTYKVYYLVTADECSPVFGDVTITINRRPLAVSGIKATSKAYDGQTEAKLDYSGVVLNGKVSADVIAVTATGTFDSADVGTGKTVSITDIKLSGKTASNYVLTEDAQQQTAKADITPAGTTLTVGKVGTKTYGGAKFDLSVKCSRNDKKTFTSSNTKVVKVDGTGKVTIVGAGKAVVTVSVAANQNYKAAAAKVAITVNKKAIRVTANDASKYEGKADPEFTFTAEGLVGKDKLTGIVLKRAAGEKSGTYTITVSQKKGANPNYNITFAIGRLVIKKSPNVEPSGTELYKKTLPFFLMKGKGTGTRIDLTWDKVKGATGYDVYWSYCNGKNNFNKLANVPKSQKYADKNLNNKREYKYFTVAYKMSGGKKVYLGRTNIVHVAMPQASKTNVLKVTVNKTKVNLAKGKTFKITKKVKLENPKKKALNHLTKKERFITSNAKVATVSSAGVIKAVRKGTCTVYVMSENGVCAKIKVTVK